MRNEEEMNHEDKKNLHDQYGFPETRRIDPPGDGGIISLGEDEEDDLESLGCPMGAVLDSIGEVRPFGAEWTDKDKEEFLKGEGYKIQEIPEEFMTIALKPGETYETLEETWESEVNLVFARVYKDFTKKLVKKLNLWIKKS